MLKGLQRCYFDMAGTADTSDALIHSDRTGDRCMAPLTSYVVVNKCEDFFGRFLIVTGFQA